MQGPNWVAKHFWVKRINSEGTILSEVVTLSRGRQNVKIYNLKTGKVTAVLETKQTQKLEGLCVSSLAFELIPG